MATDRRVEPTALALDDPQDVPFAAVKWAEDISAIAHENGISLARGGVVVSVRDAVHHDYLSAALVQLPGRNEDTLVVEGHRLPDQMRTYFAAVASGELGHGTNGHANGHAPAGAGRTLMRTAARLPGARKVADWWFGRSPSAAADYQRYAELASNQRPGEIAQLLELMRARPPRNVLEIGTASGGTAHLLCRFSAPDATIVTCDLHPRVTAHQLQRAARRRQRVVILTVDSHDPSVREQLTDRFPDGIDLLFIDGDHSYEGARTDLLMYGPLVRPGGLIVFHDIVEDYRTKYGIATLAWVGGVPELWRELRTSLPAGCTLHEFVDDEHQDGFGIGVVQLPSEADTRDVLSGLSSQ